MRALAPTLLLALVLPGCATMGDVEGRARAALDELVDAITNGGGSLSRLEGTLSGGGYTVPFLLEIARDGTRHVNLSAAGLGIDVYCRGEAVVRMVGGEPFLARGGCPLEGGRFGSPREAFEGLELASTGRDGALLVAVFEAPSGPAASGPDAEEAEDAGAVANLTLRVDGRGNARRVEMSAPGASGMNATASHEPRGRWTLPETQNRLAAAVEGDADFDAGTYAWSVDEAYDNVSLEEIEVRLVGTAPSRTMMTFRPADAREQNVSGLVFLFDDADEDGRLSERDGFTIRGGDAWRNESDFEVTVWDTWADAPLAPRRIPMPSPLAVLVLAHAVALALALVQRVSRQRG